MLTDLCDELLLEIGKHLRRQFSLFQPTISKRFCAIHRKQRHHNQLALFGPQHLQFNVAPGWTDKVKAQFRRHQNGILRFCETRAKPRYVVPTPCRLLRHLIHELCDALGLNHTTVRVSTRNWTPCVDCSPVFNVGQHPEKQYKLCPGCNGERRIYFNIDASHLQVVVTRAFKLDYLLSSQVAVSIS